MATLDHPYKQGIESLRQIILEVDPAITEGIKWNAPSFRTTEYFATTNLRGKGGISIILHRGAKSRDLPAGFSITDPGHLLKWLANDRAMVAFADLKEIADKKVAFKNIIGEWIRHLVSV